MDILVTTYKRGVFGSIFPHLLSSAAQQIDQFAVGRAHKRPIAQIFLITNGQCSNWLSNMRLFLYNNCGRFGSRRTGGEDAPIGRMEVAREFYPYLVTRGTSYWLGWETNSGRSCGNGKIGSNYELGAIPLQATTTIDWESKDGARSSKDSVLRGMFLSHYLSEIVKVIANREVITPKVEDIGDLFQAIATLIRLRAKRPKGASPWRLV